MKIAQVVCTYPPYRGGIGNVAKMFSQKLKERNHEVTVFTPKYNNSIKESKKEDDVLRLTPMLKYGNGAFMPSLLFKLKKFDCIILHFPFFGASELLWLYLFFKPKKQKIYIYFHMDVINSSLLFKMLSMPSKIIASSLFGRVDRIFCSSFDYLEHSNLKNIYHRYRSKFFEIPFGVDTERFKVGERREESGELTILFVGGLDKAHYFKGLKNLIYAFSELKTKKAKLLIVGNGDLVEEYRQLSKHLGCDDRVNILTGVSNEDLVRNYQESDIFVLPSVNRCEAFGLVLLEAMACGLPVIASNLPGVRSVFKNNVQGFLVNVNDKKDLKNKIEELINNKKLREKMSISAREIIEDKYSWDRVIDKLINHILN